MNDLLSGFLMRRPDEPDMNAANKILTDVLVLAFVAVAVMTVVLATKRVQQQRRLHHRRANRRFMRRYHDEHPPISRIAMEAAFTPPVVVRRPYPADPDAPTSFGSAGTTRRATVQTALTTSTLPVVRRSTPADVGRVPPDVLTSAGPTGRGRHAR